MKTSRHLLGFSLTELAISLTIIGLLVSSMLVGKSMIDSARRRKILSDMEMFRIAFTTFRTQYGQFPGDFNKAFSFWPTCGGATAASCNGNGDGRILIKTSGDLVTNPYSESLLVWNHLSLAGMIPGVYSGGATAGCTEDDCATPGQNVPSTGLNGVGFFVTTGTNLTALFVGKQHADSWNYESWATPPESFDMDVKVDDENPVGGFFRSNGIAGASLTNAASCYTGTAYNLSSSGKHCGGVFIFNGSNAAP